MIRTFNLERFATHDGDGIRTVVFLKGCALRCPWCANPESQSLAPTLFYHKDKCIRCGMCEKLSNGAINFANDEFHYDEKRCNNLEEIVEQCPTGALEIIGKTVSIESIVDEVMKDKEYYEASGGGVTISGGEPFTQFKDFLELLKQLKAKGLNVAVETCGNFSLASLALADPYIDTYLFDLKHLDASKYKEICGGDLEVVYNNIKAIEPSKITLRVPVIPNFNYDEETLIGIIDFAKQMKIQKLNFLPYHILALNKYEKMQWKYGWSGQSLDKKELEKYIKIAAEKDVKLKVGG